MENSRLEAFSAVALHLNSSRAAKELLLTQPATPDTENDSRGKN